MATKKKKVVALKESQLPIIASFFEKKLEWVTRASEKEVETGEPTQMTLTQLLGKELERAVNEEEEAYAEALSARTFEEKHRAIKAVIEARNAALVGTTEDENFEELEEEETELKTPRKKGWLEIQFDQLCGSYILSPSEAGQTEIMNLISQLEVNRRVRFFYDLQKLRIGAKNRSEGYARIFGIRDVFIDYAGDQLERLERHSEKMVGRILDRSADSAFYHYLVDTYLGVGPMMAGCLISEISAPERFHSVSALWKYCGLAVVGNDPETGQGGHSQRKERGELAQWNHFLRTKLLGVLSGCMIKAQTRHIGTADEKTKAQNVKVLNDYKFRQNTINNLVPERDRVYNSKGKEVFRYQSAKVVDWFDVNGKRVGEIPANRINRLAKSHINKRATRYMIKMFLIEILNQWRVLKGFEPLVPYDQAKLRGGVPHKGLNHVRILPPRGTAIHAQ